MIVTKKKYQKVIGIDPDIYLSGVAVIDLTNNDIKLSTMRYPELIGYITSLTEGNDNILVVVELDRETTHIWHPSRHITTALANKMGYDVGKCIQRGADIADMLRYLGCDVQEQKPLRKQWNGKDGKMTDAEMRRLKGITITKKRTNQEERDALLLALAWTNIPLILCQP